MVPIPTTLRGRDLLRLADWTGEEIKTVLDQAERLKARHREHVSDRLLEGRTLGMVFEKPSTRTRVSFEVAMTHLGGAALDLATDDLQLARGEPIRDTAMVLSRYVDAVVMRTASHERLDELATYADVPVINGLTELHHPCQALADLLTMRERFDGLDGLRVAFLGDGNSNVCHSLLEACALAGVDIVIASPAGYEPAADVQSRAAQAATSSGANIEIVNDPRGASTGADVLYTDVWTSMGSEAEGDQRKADFALYALDDALLELATDRALVMHCLPAHVGEEITESLLYGDRSAIWDQAENRLHAQKALLALLLR